jgi:hypothetical protein
MWRSKRPGRMTAGSRCSISLEAATTSNSCSSRCASSAVSSWLTVRATGPGSATAALRDRVELVKERHARQVLHRRLECLVDVLCQATLERADEVSRGDVDEVQAVLARDRLREERLADPRRSMQQEPVALAIEMKPGGQGAGTAG